MRRYPEVLGGAEFDRCSVPFVVGSWPVVLSCGVVFSGGPVVALPSLLVEPVIGEA